MAKTVEMAHRIESQCENWRSIGMGTHGWLIKVCFPGMVPTLDGWVPLDRADVAEVGFAVGAAGRRAGRARRAGRESRLADCAVTHMYPGTLSQIDLSKTEP